MLKKTFLLVILFLMTILQIKADDKPIDGIFVWVDRSSTCYRLSDMPTISYSGEYAILTLKGSSKPVLELRIKNGSQLEITYGTYIPTAIETAEVEEPSKVEKVGKIIRGGRLIIIRDGKQFDINGMEIK